MSRPLQSDASERTVRRHYSNKDYSADFAGFLEDHGENGGRKRATPDDFAHDEIPERAARQRRQSPQSPPQGRPQSPATIPSNGTGVHAHVHSSSPVPQSPPRADSPPRVPANINDRPNNVQQPTPGLNSPFPELNIPAQFIEMLKKAKLEDSGMRAEDIQRLRDASPDLPFDIDDPDFKFALKTFLGCIDASEKTYNSFRDAALERHPENPFLSFYQVKRRLEQITGVIAIQHDMCPDTCAAFTGPYAELEKCPFCAKSRYDPVRLERSGIKVPARQFSTFPLGPILQALYRIPEGARRMRYLADRIKELRAYADANGGKLPGDYDDVCCGIDLLEAFASGKIRPEDIVIQISFDGAQLFRDKESDCWIYIYIIHNLSPDFRYKKAYVIPGGVVPGPNKPKSTDSFLQPGLFHIAALQNEGLRIWDADRLVFVKDIIVFPAIVSADSPAMADGSGIVGYRGKYGCREYCEIMGRHRTNDGHYYPLMQKPNNYACEGCDHDDVTFKDLVAYRQNLEERYRKNLDYLVASPNPTQLSNRRTETGLTKPSIFSGLPRSLGIPKMFVMDIMHLVSLNDTDLLLGLWRGTITCFAPDDRSEWPWRVLIGQTWESHGKTVELCTPYLPSSFDRAPRNPAEKLNSGYKAWEFLLYIFGLGPPCPKILVHGHI